VELTNAYATLARGGEFVPWRLTAGGCEAAPRRVLTEETAFLVTDSLADPHARELEFGLETPLDLPFPVAGKTGTSQAFTDNVAVGYTPDRVVGVWVGNFSGKPLRGLLAMRGAAPLLREALLLAHRGRTPRAFVAPPGVREVELCADDGRLAGPDCPRRRREWVAERHSSAIEREAAPGRIFGARSTGRPAGDGAAGPSLVITAPPAGARFVIDPLLARERQRVALRASLEGGPGQRLRWLVDGAVIGEAAADEATHWTLTPGRHRVRVEAADDGIASDEIELEVEG
jgi:penicillin-binding protein 1C